MSVTGFGIDWVDLQRRHDSITTRLAEQVSNLERVGLQKELAQLGGLLGRHQELVRLITSLDMIQQQLIETSDAEWRDLLSGEITDLEQEKAQQETALEELLFPPDELDDSNVYLEIRAGAGGQEAALFAGDLLRTYINYALQQRWQVSVMSASESDLKGFKEVVIYIKGKHVYGKLKGESGVHRVQRVPETEAAGRVHTSTITVAVLPEIKDEGQIEIAPNDLRIDVYRASGAGGQHVNTTDSAVRITHLPTGVVVSCQDERSQHKNKEKAMKALKSRLLAAQIREREEKVRAQRRSLVGTGMRAEKVRTYNYPQNRVTDHRINLTLKSLDQIMEGDLAEIIAALQKEERAQRRAERLQQWQN